MLHDYIIKFTLSDGLKMDCVKFFLLISLMIISSSLMATSFANESIDKSINTTSSSIHGINQNPSDITSVLVFTNKIEYQTGEPIQLTVQNVGTTDVVFFTNVNNKISNCDINDLVGNLTSGWEKILQIDDTCNSIGNNYLELNYRNSDADPKNTVNYTAREYFIIKPNVLSDTPMDKVSTITSKIIGAPEYIPSVDIIMKNTQYKDGDVVQFIVKNTGNVRIVTPHVPEATLVSQDDTFCFAYFTSEGGFSIDQEQKYESRIKSCNGKQVKPGTYRAEIEYFFYPSPKLTQSYVAWHDFLVTENSTETTLGMTDIDGTTTDSGCNTIGGIIETITISDKFDQKIDVCKYKNYQFRIVAHKMMMVDAIGVFVDPDTKKEYRFGSSDLAPYFCDVGQNFVIEGTTRAEKTQLTINEIQHDITSRSTSRICHIEEFIPEEKKLVSIIIGNKGFTENIEFSIPQEIMSGDFLVTTNGESTPFKISNDTTNTIIGIDLDFKDTSIKTIEITSTHAIPEFPVTILVLIASIMPVIILMRTRLSL